MISSYLTLLQRRLGGGLDTDSLEFIGYAVDGAKRMDRMITDLLEYSRIGRSGAAPELVSLDEITGLAVTSLQGAAWADFLHEIERSALAFQLRVIDVRVQGEWAVTEVSAAVRTLARHPDLDVVAVIRGGGGRTELATFDHEAIATAIAMSPLPVFTGGPRSTGRSPTRWRTVR
jgi:signal transduction histidine kinase